MFPFSRIFLATIIASSLLGLAHADNTPFSLANPMVGTGMQGKTFPGAATPFGLVQLSPDTITGGDNGSGYRGYHKTIQGFSFTHMSGVGWYGDLGNFMVMPSMGPLKTFFGETNKPGTGYLSGYDKKSEVAQPGYYAVTLTDYNIRAEMTAAPHSGILRFTFPQNPLSRIQIDLARRVGGTSMEQSVKVVGTNAIEGWMKCPETGGGWGNGSGHANYTVYFHAEFSVPLQNVGVWSAEIPEGTKRNGWNTYKPEYVKLVTDAKVLSGCREMQGKHLGFYCEFPTTPNQVVMLKSGISFVSIEGARQAVKMEIPNWDFENTRIAARQLWINEFNRITVEGGTEDQRRAFYSALYHVMIDPRRFADIDGHYPGGDNQPHQSTAYTRRTIFSGWDVFRSDFPLLTLIAPTIVNDMINSMTDLANETKRSYYDRWEFLNAYSGCMVGNPIISVIADAYVKGIRDFDVNKAYEYSRNTSAKCGNGTQGYSTWYPMSQTLECAYNDWCIAQIAKGLGKTGDSATYEKRGQNFRNIFDPSVGWFRAKDVKGQWAAWSPNSMGKMWDQGCMESNPGQQGWFVPHDIPALIQLLGGPEKFTAQLDEFFKKTPDFRAWNNYYNHSNEVVHLVPFLFNRAGSPWLTQKWVRKICEDAYGPGAEGLAGDEDVGQMSAWYILCASGLHQACPGDPRYEIFTPLFEKITLNLDPKYAKGRQFVITAQNNGPQNVYIQEAMLNGMPLNRCWITHDEIIAGGNLNLVLGPQPNKNWGTEAIR